MKKIAFITPPDVEYAFQLAGVTQYAVPEPELGAVLRKVAGDPSYGLVVIDERLAAGRAAGEIGEFERRWNGIVLVLPSPMKPPPEAEDYAARLIRRAIGYHVRLSA